MSAAPTSIFTPPSVFGAAPATSDISSTIKGVPDIDQEPADFLDVDKTRKRIFEKVQRGLATNPAVENTRYRLELKDLAYKDVSAPSIAEQKEAILKQMNVDRPLHGTWVLTDKSTGKPVATKRSVIARVPAMTNRGTFILGGVDYAVANQQRLIPGIYTRRKRNGELEGYVNVAPRTGISFRLTMEPETGNMFLKSGQSLLPIYPVLKALGVSQEDLEQAWGRDIAQANVRRSAATAPTILQKAYARLGTSRDHLEEPDPVAGLPKVLARMRISPEVSLANLGAPHGDVTGPVLVRTAQKLLNISRGIEEPDDRDSQANQVIFTPDDLFAERVHRDTGGVRRRLLWRATLRGDLNGTMSNALSPQIKGVIFQSGVGMPLEEINPFSVADQLQRVTRLGEGGISGGVEAVPEESHNVSPSQLGLVDPVAGPESEKVGVDARLATGTLRGADGQIVRPVLNVRTGQTELVGARKLVHATTAFPHELESGRSKVRVISNGKIDHVPVEAVDYAIPAPQDMFSLSSNIVPMAGSIKGGRLLMGAKMSSQALPLKDRQAPFVRTAHPDGQDYERFLSRWSGAIYSKDHGTVTGISPDGIELTLPDGQKKIVELYNNFPFNRKSAIHSTAAVKQGQIVAPGHLLAGSNYTDPNGVMAIGRNLRVAYMVSPHSNYEDAIVASESGSRNLTSEHMHQIKMDDAPDLTTGRDAYLSLFPGRFTRQQLATMQDNGVVRPGTTVKMGDPIILSTLKRTVRGGSALYRGAGPTSVDASVVWDHPSDGVVTDVWRDKSGVKAVVKSYSPLSVGDKLANRYGGKGVVSAVVPDNQMPTDSEGRVFDIILNPKGVISRTNPSQMIETALGRVAEKTGKPYIVPAMSRVNMVQYALNELAKNNLPEFDPVHDPVTNNIYPQILTGRQFFMKLHHQAETKDSGRGVGSYTAEGEPQKGGDEEQQSKRFANMDLNALISHGATDVIKDFKLYRGQKNEDFWKLFRLGYPAPTPGQPFVYDKFISHLKGAGINVDRKATGIRFQALTNHDITKLSHGDLENGEAIDSKSELPVPGGLFDVGLTGGIGGKHWTTIPLQESFPSPVMEEPIRRILGMTRPQFMDALATQGPDYFKKRLSAISLPTEMARQKSIIETSRGTKRDLATRAYGYLSALQRTGIKPEELVWDKVPVIPPDMRPVTKVGPMRISSDANLLYKDVTESNKNLTAIAATGADAGPERVALYNSLKAVTGLDDPVATELKDKNVGGLLVHAMGKSSPKFSMFQRRVMTNTLDTVGRGVITPNPHLDMDQVGIPEEQAWTVYRPFIMRKLMQRSARADGTGPSAVDVASMVENKDPKAREALLEIMKERPVIINRAPVLHRFGMMGAWPVLVPGHALQVSPASIVGFGGDHDGDTMNYHVPVSDAAVREVVEKMMPSGNLLSPADFKPVYMPRHEYLHGLYLGTMHSPDADRVPPVHFASIKDLKNALRDGKIKGSTRVVVDS